MRHTFALILLAWAGAASAADVAFPKFKAQEIATDLTVGYAVVLADVNEDKKPDIVVVDSRRVVWYENPTWKVYTIVTSRAKRDNVCIAAHDIDADGHLDFVLGADWNPSNTKTGGTIQWLKRGKTLNEEWSVHPIGEEPTVHRIRMADIDGDGKAEVIVAPLHGREATAKGNYMDGRPVRLLAYPIPKDPMKGPWTPKVLSEELHVVHNIWPIAVVKQDSAQSALLASSYEGVHAIGIREGNWVTNRIGEGNQANPKGTRGASEVKMGLLENKPSYIATIEPWHGNQVVVYTAPKEGEKLWERRVIDDHLRWGHAVWCADLDGEDGEELIIGVRDNPAKGDTFTEKCGVRIYKATDGVGKKWARLLVEDGGVAVEDLTAGDLNGDGKIDIVAVGRQTKNARIYWNQGK